MNRSNSLEIFLSPSTTSSPIEYWTLTDSPFTTSSSSTPSSSSLIKEKNKGIFPLSSFYSLSREVINLQRSFHFYCNILGFQKVRDSNFNDCWLFGYGVRSLFFFSFSAFSLFFSPFHSFSHSFPSFSHFFSSSSHSFLLFLFLILFSFFFVLIDL